MWRTPQARVWLGALLAVSCTTESNFLGFDRLQAGGSDAAPAASTSIPHVRDAGPKPRPTAPSTTGSNAQPTPEPDSGTDLDAGMTLTSLDAATETETEMDAGAPDAATGVDGGRPELPNHFVDVLGVTPEEVLERIDATYEQLFHGNLDSESIYYEVGEDEAFVYDRNHDDTRMDAAGYGLLVSVELDRQTEFNRIWAFTKRRLQFTSGAQAGYFADKCPTSGENCLPDLAVMGSFFTATALFFAEARWGNGEDIYDYGAEARAMLETMLQIEERNMGVVDGITNTFNPDTALPQKTPTEEHREHVFPGAVWPAFFEIWHEKTGDEFWRTAAEQGRSYLNVATHPESGLIPTTTDSSGAPIETFEGYNGLVYQVSLSLALDHAWYGKDPEQVVLANRLISFFNKFGGSYPAKYHYDGTVEDSTSVSGALVAMNGTAAGIASIPQRVAFIRAVWNTPTPVGYFRYFDGITHLLALMYLGGELRPF